MLQTEPAPIVCRDGEDKAGQRQDICKQCKTSPQRCADPNPNAPPHDTQMMSSHPSSPGPSEQRGPQEDVLVLKNKKPDPL